MELQENVDLLYDYHNNFTLVLVQKNGFQKHFYEIHFILLINIVKIMDLTFYNLHLCFEYLNILILDK